METPGLGFDNTNGFAQWSLAARINNAFSAALLGARPHRLMSLEPVRLHRRSGYGQ